MQALKALKFAILTAITSIVSTIYGETYTWTGNGADIKWTTTGNWSPEGEPGNNDFVIFNKAEAMTVGLDQTSSNPVALVQAITVVEGAGQVTITLPPGYGTQRTLQFRRFGGGSEIPAGTNFVNRSSKPVIFDQRVAFGNYAGDGTVMPGAVYNKGFYPVADAKVWFLSPFEGASEEMRTSLFNSAAVLQKGMCLSANHIIKVSDTGTFSVTNGFDVYGTFIVDGGTVDIEDFSLTHAGGVARLMDGSTVNARSLALGTTAGMGVVQVEGNVTLNTQGGNVTIGTNLVFTSGAHLFVTGGGTLSFEGTSSVYADITPDMTVTLNAWPLPGDEKMNLVLPTGVTVEDKVDLFNVSTNVKTVSDSDFSLENSGDLTLLQAGVAVHTEDDIQTISIALPDYVYCIGSSQPYNQDWTNEGVWSNSTGVVSGPVTNAMHLVAKSSYFRLNTTLASEVMVFPGSSLILTSTASSLGALNFVGLKGRDNTISNLRLGSCCGISFHTFNANGGLGQTLKGAIFIGATTKIHPAYVLINPDHPCWLDSVISGFGELDIIPNADDKDTTKGLEIRGDNSGFTGKIKIANRGSDVTKVTRVTVGSGIALGGAMDEARADALELAQAELSVTNTTALAKNRGMTVSADSTIVASNDFTVAAASVIASGKTLTKRGAGVLTFNGALNGGTLKVEEGGLSLLGGAMLTALALPADATLTIPYGTETAPVTVDTMTLSGNVAVTLDGMPASPRSGTTTVPLFVVNGGAAPDASTVAVNSAVSRYKFAVRSETSGGVTAYYADGSYSGFALFIR